MIYFCADDYGISDESNKHIENCIKNGALNKVSVLANGEIKDFKQRLTDSGAKISLHINLVEGRPLSDGKLLMTDSGYFKYSFVGLLALSLSVHRKEFEKELYKEIHSQIKFWKEAVGENNPVSIDSHQHTHMIPLIFKTLMKVIKDEGLDVECIRIPAEPFAPYLLTPSLYLTYSLTGLLKQWLLKACAFVNHKELKKSKIPYTYFMGVMFSGKLTEEKIKKLLPRYKKIADKNGRDIEIGFHPGYSESGNELICGSRDDFHKFYFSPWRKIEHDTLINFKL